MPDSTLLHEEERWWEILLNHPRPDSFVHLFGPVCFWHNTAHFSDCHENWGDSFRGCRIYLGECRLRYRTYRLGYTT